jgi:hypothetical protein
MAHNGEGFTEGRVIVVLLLITFLLMIKVKVLNAYSIALLLESYC